MLVYSISTMVTMVGGHGDHGSYFQICTLTRTCGKHFSTFPSRFSRSVHRSCIFFKRHRQKRMICIYSERYIYMSIYRYGQTYSIYPSKPHSSYQFSTSRGFNVFQLLWNHILLIQCARTGPVQLKQVHGGMRHRAADHLELTEIGGGSSAQLGAQGFSRKHA